MESVFNKLKKQNVTFKPRFCEESKWYKCELFLDGETTNSFLHWIEISDGSICRIDWLRGAKGIAELEETAIAVCEELQRLYDNDEIGTNYKEA